MSVKTAAKGRNLNGLVGQIREQIASSYYREGGLLPSTRELAERFGVSSETVRRGLKQLEDEGVLRSEPRTGFRISGSTEASRTRPIAYITDYHADLSDAQPATGALALAFQGAASARSWSILGAHGAGRAADAVVGQVRAASSWGVLLDTMNPGLCSGVLGAGLPVVMVNAWFEDAAVDVVLQDNYRGGFLAAEHLIGGGARRLACLGRVGEYCHSRERYAGACAALAKHNLPPAEICVPGTAPQKAQEVLVGLLGRPDRPDGLLAFSDPSALVPAMAAAAQLGLEPGRDVGMVGWTVEECYETHYRPLFAGGAVPPAVVWRASGMAERALELLEVRAAAAGRDPVRVCVPTQLRLAAN